MVKINIIRAILIVLIISTFFVIFGFSSQNSEESGGISKKITQIITSKIKSIQNKPQNEKEKILTRIESIIRKLAHFSIYMVVRNISNGTSFNI